MINYQNIKNFKIPLNSANFIILISLYFGFVLNLPVEQKFIQLAAASGDGVFAYFSPLLLSAAFAVIFSLFNIPYLRKPFFIFLVVTSAAASYASYNYGVIFDYPMVENIFATNSGEAFSYLNLNVFLYIFFVGIVPAVLISRISFKKDYAISIRFMQKMAVVFSALAIIACIYATSYKSYASVGRNNPYLNKMINPAHIYNTVKYINKTYFSTPLEYKAIGEDARAIAPENSKPSLIIFVVGETARSMNIHYNGYARNTNPYTEDLNIISFKNVSSCGTATAHSLPCMFSNLDRKNYKKERANSQDNALDIIQRAGTAVLWVENDGGDKAVAKHLNKIEIKAADYPAYCAGGVCSDEVMLQEFDKNVIVDALSNQLFAFHIIGSHGPTYWKRYPQEQELFTPSCNRSDIENCSDQEIINVYDNTLAYTDFVIARLIERLKQYSDQYNVALMYMSDHGESLGENGLYLHGTPYSLAPEEQTKVPWYLWMDSSFADAYHIDRQCLQSKANNDAVSQDNLFHTLIHFAGVKSSAVNSDKSLIAACRY